MPQRLTWKDPVEIGLALYEAHGARPPLDVSFVQMHRWILALPGFDDDPKGSSEKVLEAVQMAWYDEWKLDHG